MEGSKHVQIELYFLNEQSKAIVKRNFYDILNNLNIKEDTDLALVSYCTTKTDCVFKLIVGFRLEKIAQKFSEYLSGGNLKKHNLEKIKMSEFDESTQKRRNSNSSTDSYQLIPEDRSLSQSIAVNVETSLYEQFQSDMAKSTSTLMEKSMSQSMMAESLDTLQTEKRNHFVEFYSDQPIQDQDLDMILLYLENSKKSGGGEYEEYALDVKKHLLNIKYKKYIVKLRVLNKKNIKIVTNSKEFNLIANEPLSTDSFEINNSIIILRNIDENWLKDETISIYAENLVINDDENNEVENIRRSEIFNKTIFVKYKIEFDPEKLKMRYERRPTLNKIQIDIQTAYKTKIVLVKAYDSNGEKISKDLIEMYFANKRRCGGENYSSIHEREPFLLLSYDTQEACDSICARKHEVSKYKLIVEPLFNFEILENQLKNSEIQEPKVNSEIKLKVEEPEVKQELKTPVIQYKRPFIKLDSERDKELEILVSNSDLLEKFREDLSAKNSSFSHKVINNKIDIICECTLDLPSDLKEYKRIKHDWEKEIANFTSQFLKEIKPQVVENLSKKTILTIDSFEEPKLKILKTFDSTYLKEFESELMDRQASLSLKEKDGVIEIVCECTHELPSNVTEFKELEHKWKQDISNFVKMYFQQFDIKEITVKYPNQTLPKIRYDELRVNLKQKDTKNENGVFEVSGFAEQVDKLIIDIQSEDILPRPIDEKKIDDVITGLELYQVRVLFIEKFIKQLKDKHNDMSVEINPRALKVYLKGTQSQIEEAKILCKDILSQIKHKDVPMHVFKVKFFKVKEKDVVDWLRGQEDTIRCVLMPDTSAELVRIYSIQISELQRCEELINKEIDYKDIGKDLLEGIPDITLDSFIHKHRNDEGILIDKENGMLHICGFKSKAEELFTSFLNELFH